MEYERVILTGEICTVCIEAGCDPFHRNCKVPDAQGIR
jgi:hypothetical protein